MSNALTICLPEELMERVREASRLTGLPVGKLVRDALETSLSREKENPLLKFAGVVKGGPRNLSSRNGFWGE